MKNRKLNMLVVLLLIANYISSQTKTDSVSFKKNEISINLLPTMSLLGGFDIVQSKHMPLLHLNYKRLLNEKIALRLGLSVLSNPEKNGDYNEIEKIIANNSKVNISYLKEDGSGVFQVNIGLERRWGKNKIKQFAGLDLGYSYYNSSKKEMFGIRDSLTYATPYSYSNEGKPLHSNDSVVNHTRKNVHSIIVTPFYGIKIDVSKRFFVSAQVGIDISASYHKFLKSDINSNFKKPIDYTSFGINTSGVSTNILFGIRF